MPLFGLVEQLLQGLGFLLFIEFAGVQTGNRLTIAGLLIHMIESL